MNALLENNSNKNKNDIIFKKINCKSNIYNNINVILSSFEGAVKRNS